MKLISCYIENFGGLSEQYISFQEGVNVFHEPNGWGKSTLAAFLKAMFYGLEQKKEKDALEKERNLYMPWQGGTFGGELEFETQGKCYRVIRSFGRTAKTDQFHLYDGVTNLESSDFSSNLGEELFQLDAASFRRSVFVEHNSVLTESTDAMNAKLGNLVENTNDMNNYETAQRSIKNKMNQISPERVTGTINKRSNRITQLQEQLRALERLETEYCRQKDIYHSWVERETRFLEEEKAYKESGGGRREKKGKMEGFSWAGILCFSIGILILAAYTFIPVPIIFAVIFMLVGGSLFIIGSRKRTEASIEAYTKNLDQVREKIEVCRDNIQKCEHQLESYREELCQKPELEQMLLECKRKQEQEQEQYQVLALTQQYLQQAKEQLTAHYMEPVSRGFHKYYEQIMKKFDDRWMINADMQLFMKQEGEYREARRLSQGCQDLIGICMRFALVDAMYQSQKPFLILDDPFINFDNDTMQYAEELLQKLGQEYQVIYFTCHESRIP